MTNEEIANSIRTALATHATSGAAGVVNVTIDGISTTWSFDQAKKELEFWERRAARASGKKKFVCTLDLRGA